MPIRVTVWNEFYDDPRHPAIQELYPGGVQEYLASVLREEPDMAVTARHFYEDDACGLSDEVLDSTDVLLVYGHILRDNVPEDRVKKLIERVVKEGMGVIFLHSALWMNLFQRLVGPGAYCGYRELGERERVWVVNRNHPIAAGLPSSFVIPHTEVYSEPAGFPDPDELVFISWYQGGEAARSGMVWRRGAGRIFYFSPGHAWYNAMQIPEYHTVIKNAVRWAVPPSSPPPLNRSAELTPLEDIVLAGEDR
ncbi:MAG: trehalose utilization protein ThuA [Provencibacterium sp.]|jgi:trehalose utilization protein|nr:trehalose utilization protein ThuA [Provencibacterium sp.]